jgi:hypothetical protein
MKNRVCTKCGIKAKGNCDLPAIVFDSIDGSPVICEKCLAEFIFGKKFDWGTEWSEWINRGMEQ